MPSDRPRCEHTVVEADQQGVSHQCVLPEDHIAYGIEQHKYIIELFDGTRQFNAVVQWRNFLEEE